MSSVVRLFVRLSVCVHMRLLGCIATHTHAHGRFTVGFYVLAGGPLHGALRVSRVALRAVF